MRSRTLPLLAALACVLAGEARSQTVVGAIGGDVKNALGDMWGVWASPFHARGRDWLTAGSVLALAAALSPLDDDVDRYMAARKDSRMWAPLKELRQGGALFSGQTITPVVAGVWVIGLATNNRSIRDGVMGCGASYAASSVVRTQVLYRMVQRTRPDSSRSHETVAPPARQGDQYHFRGGSGEWGTQSMPAGHVANIAACASFLSHRFKMGWGEPVLYLVVGAVGLGRVVDRAHWTSDSVLGALFGYAVGREVGRRSLDRFRREHPDSAGTGAGGAPGSSESMQVGRGFYVAPAGGGLIAGWRATF